MALSDPEHVPLAIAAHAAIYGAWRTALSWADRRWPLRAPDADRPGRAPVP